MGRRTKRGFARLALMIGTPLLVLWGISLWLHQGAVRELRRTIGAGPDASYVDHVADQLVAQRMNGWVGGGGPLFLVIVLGLLAAAIHFSFVAPVRPARRLRTRRLVLRRIRPGDAPAFNAMLSDPATLRYWGQAPHQSLDETARWLRDPEADQSQRDEFVITRKGRVIGMIGARQWPWVTYILHDAECGKGYGGEALAAFIRYAFGRGCPTLFVATDARNAASLAMVRRRGFREVHRGPITHPTGETIEGVWLRLDELRWKWPGLRRAAAPDKAVA